MLLRMWWRAGRPGNGRPPVQDCRRRGRL